VVIYRLETAVVRNSAGEEVRHMRAYHVRVFIPTVIEIQADDEAQALVKVGEFYQKLYAEDLRDWIHPELLPEDVE
jgi:hypothetical protein